MHTDNMHELDLTTCAHLDTLIVASSFKNSLVSSCFATCSKHRYSDYFQKSYDSQENKRGLARRVAETAEHRQGRLMKHRERDRAGRSILTAAA